MMESFGMPRVWWVFVFGMAVVLMAAILREEYDVMRVMGGMVIGMIVGAFFGMFSEWVDDILRKAIED